MMSQEFSDVLCLSEINTCNYSKAIHYLTCNVRDLHAIGWVHQQVEGYI